MVDGVTSRIGSNRIMVYPNPFENSINLPVPTNNSFNYEFEVFDSKGEIIEHGLYNEQIEIDTKEFPIGLYVIKIKDEKSQYFLKILKLKNSLN